MTVFCVADNAKKQGPGISKKVSRKREKIHQDTASVEVSEASDELPNKCEELKPGLQKGGVPAFRGY